MANICMYKGIVKGKKNACYAFLGSMPVMCEQYIYEEKGTEDSFTIYFGGDCKWYVDCSRKTWRGQFPVALPKDSEKAFEKGEKKYSHITMQDRSKMFECEVWCNYADIDDYDPPKGLDQIFVHYKQGEIINGRCPTKLKLKKIIQPWGDYDFV